MPTGRFDLPEWTAPIAELPGTVAPATFVPAEPETAYRWRMVAAVSIGCNVGFLTLAFLLMWLTLWP